MTLSRRARTILRFVFSGILTVVFLYLAFRGTDFGKLLESMKQANYGWLLLSVVCVMVSHGVRALRWRYLLNPIKRNIGFRNLFSGVMIGYLMNNIIPRAGELVRPYTIGKLEAIPKGAALGTIVVERILDTISFVVLVAMIPLVYDGPLRETFPWLEDAGTIITVFTLALLGLVMTMMLKRNWTSSALGKLNHVLPPRIVTRIERGTHSFLDGFLFLRQPRSFFMIAVLSVVIWGLYILMMYVAFFAFDLKLGMRAALVVQAISSIGVALPTPGATGTYHMFTSQTLSRLFSVSDEVALSYATMTHAFGYIGITIVGLYYFLNDHIRVSEAVEKFSEDKA
jgi:uncharacterized protein (TIRG00374 family)